MDYMDQYISDKAFAIFTNLNERNMITYMHYLKSIHFRFDLEQQPEAWIQCLIMSRNLDGDLAFGAADIYLCIDAIFGFDMICKDASECYGTNITIMQALVIHLEYMQRSATYDFDEESLILHIMQIHANRRR